MIRNLVVAISVLVLAFSCNGGKLDAFVEHDASVSGNGAGGGAAPTGGRGGTSGTSLGGEGGDNGTAERLLIDDFEDGNQIALLENAEWYVSNNATGVQNLTVAEPSVERPGSTYSLHTSGVGFRNSGASLVLGIAGDAASYDASAFQALTFSARAEVGASRDLLFAFLVGSQHFAVPLRLNTEWSVHTIPFAAAIPVQPGPDTSFDPSRLAAIQFIAPEVVSFDFWLDDLAFVE